MRQSFVQEKEELLGEAAFWDSRPHVHSPFSNAFIFMQIKQLLLTEPVARHKDYAWSAPQEMQKKLLINLTVYGESTREGYWGGEKLYCF